MAKSTKYTFIGDFDVSKIVSGIQQIQNHFNSLKIPTTMNTKQLQNQLTNASEAVKKLQSKLNTGFKSSKEIQQTIEEVQQLKKSLESISKETIEINIDNSKLKDTSKELKELKEQQRDARKEVEAAQSKRTFLDKTITDKLQGKALSKFNTARASMNLAAKTGDIEQLNLARNKSISKIQSDKNISGTETTGQKSQAIAAVNALYEQLKIKVNEVSIAQQNLASISSKVATQQEIDGAKLVASKQDFIEKTQEQINSTNQLEKELKDVGRSLEGKEDIQRQTSELTSRLKYLTSFTSVMFMLRRAFSDAAKEIRELDTAFNEISVVSGKTMEEMWDSFSSVNTMAQQFGVTTKGVVDVQNMYYHQGLKTADVNRLTAETLTMAKISGLDYADATDKMTAAMNAFAIQSEDIGVITDTFAALASSAATSVEELANAMTKTASISASAGMDIASTSVFLTKMIETTRESSENLGTALKTITARFTELKENVDLDEDGAISDFNKVDTALKSAGVQLVDTAGQFRDLNDVFMDLSKVWDTLDRNTQRYIATQAAGSRQQSRFIAMMEDYDRTLELTEIAQNAAGTGAQQLDRSQQSLETTLNKIKGSWQELYTTYIKSDLIRNALNLVNNLLGKLNDLNDLNKTLALIFTGIGAGVGVKLGTDLITNIANTITDKKDKIKKSLTNLIKESRIDPNAFIETQKTISAKKGKTPSSLKITQKAAKAGIQRAFGDADLINRKEINKEVEKYNQLLLKAQEYEKTASTYGLNERGLLAVKLQTSANYEKANSQKEVINEMLKEEAIMKGLSADQIAQIALDTTENRTLKLKDKIIGGNTNEYIKLALAKKINSDATKDELVAEIASNGVFKLLTKALKVQTKAKLSDVAATILQKTVQMATNPVFWVAAAAIAAVGAVIGVVTLARLKDKKAIEESAEAAKAETKAFEDYDDKLTELKDLTTTYNKALELQKKGTTRTSEETEEYNNLIQDLAEKYPQLIDYIDEETGAINEQSDAYAELLRQKRDAAKASIETGYNAITLFSEGTQIDNEDLKKSIQEIKQSTSDTYANVLNAIENEDETSFMKSLTKKGVSESQIKDALMQQQISGFNLETVNSLLGEQLSAEQFQIILNQIEDFNADFTDKAFLEATGLDKDAGKALKAWYNQFQSEINNEITALNSAGVEQSVETLKAQQYGTVAANTLGKSLTSSLSNIVGEMLTEGGKADQDLIEKFIDEYFNTLSETEQQTIEKYLSNFENIKPEDWEEKERENTEAILSAMGLSEEVVNSIIKTLDERVQKINEELKKSLGTIGLEDTGKYTKAQADAMLKVYGNIEQELGETSAKDFIKDFDAFVSGNNLSQEQKEALFGLDWTDVDAIAKVASLFDKDSDALNNFNNLVAKSGDISKKNFGQLNERVEKVKKTVSELEGQFESLGDAVRGELSFEDMADLVAGSEGNIDFGDFTVTSEGYKLTADQAENARKAILNNAKAKLEETKSTMELARANILAQMAQTNLTLAEVESTIALTDDKDKKARLQQSVEQLTTSYNLQAESLKQLEQQFENLSDQEQLLSSIEVYLELKSEKELADAAADSAKKLADKLKDVYDRLKAIADLIEGIDKWIDIENLEDILDMRLEDYEKTIELNVNLEINKDAIRKQVKTINKQIAVERAKQQVASNDISFWSNQAEKTGYWKIGKDGNIAKTQKYFDLVSSARNAQTQEEIEKIKTEIEYADKFGEKYKEAYEKLHDATDKEIDLLNQLKEIQKKSLQQMSDLSKTLLDIMIANDEKELEDYKSMVDKKKEALEDYLDAVQDSIDKERNMRDLADKEEDLRQKERKLSILQMDTSGLYAGDIASLQKEISDDRRSLEDSYVDKYIDDLTTKLDNQKEAYDRDIEAWEEYLEWKKEDMTLYQEEIDTLISQGADKITEYINTKSNEIQGMTTQQLENFKIDTENTVNLAIGYYQSLADNGIQEIFYALGLAKEETGNINAATNTFANNAETSYDGVKQKISEATNAISTLTIEVQDVLTNAWKAAEDAADKYYKKLQEIANLKNTGVDIDPLGGTYPKGNDKDNNKITVSGTENLTSYVGAGAGGYDENGKKLGVAVWGNAGAIGNDTQGVVGEKYRSQIIGVRKGKDNRILIEMKNDPGVWYIVDQNQMNKDTLSKLKDILSQIDSDKKGAKLENGQWTAFKTGGYVDYTGPAWVDGTPTKPEAFLNSNDTARMETLIGVLQQLDTRSSLKDINTQASQNQTNNNTFSITINVDELGDEYDVEKLAEDLQDIIYNNMNKNQVTQIWR